MVLEDGGLDNHFNPKYGASFFRLTFDVGDSLFSDKSKPDVELAWEELIWLFLLEFSALPLWRNKTKKLFLTKRTEGFSFQVRK